MSGWNGSSSAGRAAQPQKPVKSGGVKPSVAKGIVAGLIAVVVAIAVGFFMLSGDKTEQKGKTEKKAGQIKEVKPAPAPRSVEKPVELTPEQKEKRRRAAGGMYTNDYGYVYNRPIRGNAITNDMNETVSKTFADTVFDNFVDRSIGGLIDAEPGTVFVGDSRSLFGPSFKKKFLKSLETPIIVSKDDPPDVASLKRAVIDSKIELKARLDAGEDIGEIMVKARDELQSLALFKSDLEKELKTVARDRTLTEDEMKDFVDAANKMMAERGMGKLEMPRMAARRFERERLLKNQKTENLK